MFVFIVIAIFTLAILVHEVGHYVAARLCGVGVTALAVGLGKTLWSRRLKSGLELRINLIPLGGYCLMKSVQTTEPYVSEEDGTEYYDDSYLEFAGLWRQIVIFLGGITFNVILATVLLLVLNLNTHTYQADADWLVRGLGPTGKMIISALYSPVATMVSTPYEFFMMVTTKLQALTETAAGPVGIVMMGKPEVTVVTFTDQLVSYAYFTVFLNKVLAGFNILPLVPLDGGQIVNLVLQKLFGRKVSIAFSICTVFVIVAIFVFAIKNDMTSLYRALGPTNGAIVLGAIVSLSITALVRFVAKHWQAIAGFMLRLVRRRRTDYGSSGQAQG